VPVLLDFTVGLHRSFAAEHGRRLRGYRAPSGEPRPGERLTQASFSTEWLTVRDDELTFTYTHRDREDFIRIELGDYLSEARAGGALLDVGCGYGTEARLLQRATGMETYGTDLNLSLLAGGPALDREPNVHLVVASLFALPFPRRTFDLVYSHGVLHHTFSTSGAFDAIADFVATDGTLCIWVYAKSDFDRGLRLRASAAAERALRPLVAAAPAPVQSAVVHTLSVPHFARYRRLGLNRQRWHYRNSVHSIRDRWTPRYAHRHESDEVDGWFRADGFEPVAVDSAAYERRFGMPLIGIGRRGSRRPRDP
jgi:SAM-dependent methyltransferase